LRRAGIGVLHLTEFGEDPGLEERLDQPQHALVLDPGSHAVHQGHMVDPVKARLDVRIQHPLVSLGAEQVDLGDRVVCAPLGPEPVGDRLEVGLEDRFQHQFQRRLNDPVGHRGNPQAPHLAGPTRFGDLAFPHRFGPELPGLDLHPEVIQELRDTDFGFDPGDGPPVRTSGLSPSVGRDPVPRHDQRGRVMHEIEQVVEPATRIGHRPTVKLGLHLRYPPTRTHRHITGVAVVGRGVTVRWRIFRHYSLQSLLDTTAVLRHVTGSPGLGLLRRLRPIPDRSADGVPSPKATLDA